MGSMNEIRYYTRYDGTWHMSSQQRSILTSDNVWMMLNKCGFTRYLKLLEKCCVAAFVAIFEFDESSLCWTHAIVKYTCIFTDWSKVVRHPGTFCLLFFAN